VTFVTAPAVQSDSVDRAKSRSRLNGPQWPRGRASSLLSDSPEKLRGPGNRPRHRQCQRHLVRTNEEENGNAGRKDRGREATYMAIENDKRRPIALDPAPSGSVDLVSEPRVPAKIDAKSRTAPPRVLKPSRGNDQVCAPTPDLEGHRAALRRVFGTRRRCSENSSQPFVPIHSSNPMRQLSTLL
jgi:hypothetical protein